LAVAELETASVILVEKAGSEHGVAVVVFPGSTSIVWGGGAGPAAPGRSAGRRDGWV